MSTLFSEQHLSHPFKSTISLNVKVTARNETTLHICDFAESNRRACLRVYVHCKVPVWDRQPRAWKGPSRYPQPTLRPTLTELYCCYHGAHGSCLACSLVPYPDCGTGTLWHDTVAFVGTRLKENHCVLSASCVHKHERGVSVWVLVAILCYSLI